MLILYKKCVLSTKIPAPGGTGCDLYLNSAHYVTEIALDNEPEN